jgi:hypothetical protein
MALTHRDRLNRRPIAELRDAGLLICHCLAPVPVWLALWQDYECARCGRPVMW